MKEALRDQQEALAVRALLADWRMINDDLFGSTLRAPILRLTPGASTLGAWRVDGRELTIQREFVFQAPWGRVVEVLKHEMAHQFVDEVLGIWGEGPHGQAFRHVCAERAIDARAFEPANPTSEETRSLLGRVEKLLALAGSDNRHEAEAAMQRAQALMRTYNLQPARREGDRRYGFVQLGMPKGRIFEPARRLAVILSDHFFVDTLWVSAFDVKIGRRGWVLEACGTDENLAIAEYVHGFLWDTAERLWRAHREAHDIRTHRDRRRFYTGVMRGFAEKLEQSRTKATGRGLVWVQDADLMTYFRKRHPRVRTVRRAGERGGEVLEAGRAAGRRVVLSKPIETSRSRGRLLGPGR